MVLIHWHIVVKIYIVQVKQHGTHPLTYCCKDLHSTGKTAWYSSIDILMKILNIDHNTLSYNKNKFNTILQQIVHKKYVNDWQQRNESMKNGKLKTYLALKTNWSRKVSWTTFNIIKDQYVDFAYHRTDYKWKLVDIEMCLEMKEYNAKNVPKMKLRMKSIF
jgi:hypothetical protein